MAATVFESHHRTPRWPPREAAHAALSRHCQARWCALIARRASLAIGQGRSLFCLTQDNTRCGSCGAGPSVALGSGTADRVITVVTTGRSPSPGGGTVAASLTTATKTTTAATSANGQDPGVQQRSVGPPAPKAGVEPHPLDIAAERVTTAPVRGDRSLPSCKPVPGTTSGCVNDPNPGNGRGADGGDAHGDMIRLCPLSSPGVGTVKMVFGTLDTHQPGWVADADRGAAAVSHLRLMASSR